MSRQSTIARAARLEGKPDLVCVGRFSAGGEDVDFPYSEDDLARDVTWWGALLSRYGVSRGKRVVVTTLAWEAPWSLSVRSGVNRAGGVYSNAEFWGWDARRLDMFVRRITPHAVIGPGRELLESLGNIVDLRERLADVPVLLVRPDAAETLQDAGMRPTGIIVPVGPTVAVSLPDGSGLAVDENEWAVEDQDGELLITTVGPRAATFDRQRTGVRGRVERTPAGVRIQLEE